jgi:hypothetical protein
MKGLASGNIAMVVFLSAAMPSAADDIQIVVTPAGAPAETQQYTSIQAAINAAPAGATVRLGPGTFPDPILINKPVTLEGAGAGQTILTADWRTLKEVVVDGAGVPPEKQQRYQELRRIAIEKEYGEGPVTAQLWQEFGPLPTLTVENTAGVAIRGLSITMPGTVWKEGWQNFHMVLLQNAGATLERCAFVGSAVDGVDIRGESAVTLRNCLVGGIRSSGVVINASKNARIHLEECDIRECGYAGVQIKGAGEIAVTRCRISQIQYHGIRYDDVSPTITGNAFWKIVRSGIYIDGQTKGSISENLFLDCAIGGSQDTIAKNTFVCETCPWPAGKMCAAIISTGAGEQRIERNVIVGYDHALLLYATDKKPLTREAKHFEKNLCDTRQSALVSSYAIESKGSYGPQELPELQSLPLPNGNWQMPVQFTDPKRGDYSLSAGLGLSDRDIGSRKHVPLLSPWIEQPAERAMWERIEKFETPAR